MFNLYAYACLFIFLCTDFHENNHLKTEHAKSEKDIELTELSERKTIANSLSVIRSYNPYQPSTNYNPYQHPQQQQQQQQPQQQSQQQPQQQIYYQQPTHGYNQLHDNVTDYGISKNPLSRDCGVPIPATKPKIWSLADTVACKTPPPTTYLGQNNYYPAQIPLQVPPPPPPPPLPRTLEQQTTNSNTNPNNNGNNVNNMHNSPLNMMNNYVNASHYSRIPMVYTNTNNTNNNTINNINICSNNSSSNSSNGSPNGNTMSPQNRHHHHPQQQQHVYQRGVGFPEIQPDTPPQTPPNMKHNNGGAQLNPILLGINVSLASSTQTITTTTTIATATSTTTAAPTTTDISYNNHIGVSHVQQHLQNGGYSDHQLSPPSGNNFLTNLSIARAEA